MQQKELNLSELVDDERDLRENPESDGTSKICLRQELDKGIPEEVVTISCYVQDLTFCAVKIGRRMCHYFCKPVSES